MSTMNRFADTPPDRFLEEFYTAFQEEALTCEGDLGAVVDRYFSPGFLQVSDGIAIDREKLIAHLRPMRKMVESGHYEVREALADGDRLAARMVIRAVTRKGKRIDTEVHLFGALDAQGRFTRLDQITRTLRDE
ncbi:nuclear transport factor 2 family protein [Streptomyces sp. NPDC048172]|uniref:nuclear transport factor 2 family protein n=1 Tax=Streptomyces sp. NPDC048172 TaxID=3365505 RepID=UPI0037170849